MSELLKLVQLREGLQQLTSAELTRPHVCRCGESLECRAYTVEVPAQLSFDRRNRMLLYVPLVSSLNLGLTGTAFLPSASSLSFLIVCILS